MWSGNGKRKDKIERLATKGDLKNGASTVLPSSTYATWVTTNMQLSDQICKGTTRWDPLGPQFMICKPILIKKRYMNIQFFKYRLQRNLISHEWINISSELTQTLLGIIRLPVDDIHW